MVKFYQILIIFYFISSINCLYLPHSYRQKRDDKQNSINYLKTFDYLTDEEIASPSFDILYKNALKRFQELNGLSPTGQLDKFTIQKMAEPRCGRSDLYNVRTSDVVPWKNSTVTYSISSNSTLFSHQDLKVTIRRVFDIWSANIPRTFNEVEDELFADIKIRFVAALRFGKREHGDGAPFDGPGGILAHAFIKGLLHFDDDEIWKRYLNSDKLVDGTKDIFWVALHEAGHVLGLDHTKVFDSIMQPAYVTSMDDNGNYIEPSLIPTDIEDIQEIYGGKTKPKIDTTQVANGAKLTVYAVVQRDKDYLQSVTADFFEEAEKANWQMKEIPPSSPFTQILAGSFKTFNPQAAKNTYVYVTAFTHNTANGKMEKIADGYEILSNSGVVIGIDNKIYDVVSGKLWVDPNGVSHSRRPPNV